MDLFDAVKKEKGKPFNVKNYSRNQLPEFCKKMGYKVGAEVGVYKGEHTERFCKAGLTMYGIDPWMAFRGQGRTQQKQDRQDFLFGHAKRVLKPYKNCTLIRKTSMDALENFPDRSLDFVYIDGDHCFQHVAADIFWWSRKVKGGGMIAGHDYFCTDPAATNIVCHVQAVVDAYVRAFGIQNFYTFGRSKPLEEETKNDKYLSWMWLNP